MHAFVQAITLPTFDRAQKPRPLKCGPGALPFHDTSPFEPCRNIQSDMPTYRGSSGVVLLLQDADDSASRCLWYRWADLREAPSFHLG